MRIAWVLPPLESGSSTLAQSCRLMRALRLAGHPAELYAPASPTIPDPHAAHRLLAREHSFCVGLPHVSAQPLGLDLAAADAAVLVRPNYLCALVGTTATRPAFVGAPLDVDADEFQRLLVEAIASAEEDGTTDDRTPTVDEHGPDEAPIAKDEDELALDADPESELTEEDDVKLGAEGNADGDATKASDEDNPEGAATDDSEVDSSPDQANGDAIDHEESSSSDGSSDHATDDAEGAAKDDSRKTKVAASAKNGRAKASARTRVHPWRTATAWLSAHQPWVTYAKYLFGLIASLVGCYVTQSPTNLIFALLELVGIAFVTESLLHLRQLWGQIANDILMALFDLQVAFLVFSRSYITLVMVTNVTSLEDLGGNATVYLAAVAVYLLFCMLPVTKLTRSGRTAERSLSGVLAVELVAAMILGNGFSPLFAYVSLAQQKSAADILASGRANAFGASSDFYVASIVNHREKPKDLAKRPNVILILTEGLSSNVIDDPRGIMPNVALWRDQSLSFDNYYNHTFATYRGIIGQLYSGYQLDNLDSNSLVSIQSIFSNKGYRTAFLNVEPDNAEFTSYLGRLGFDTVITDRDAPRDGYASSISDAYAYDRLFEIAEEMGEAKEPFFLVVYTLGTHVSFDSVGARFGDGTNAELNKFYECDQQFGSFMNRLVESDLAKDTMVVFTTDHASYADLYYQQAFPNYMRQATALDQIPLFIWWLGIKPEVVDVDGRNSLDLAPTILDYLDMTAPNYFLGTSLFAEGSGDYDTVFFDTNQLHTSKGRLIGDLSSAQSQLTETRLQRYFAASSTIPTESETAPLVTATREAVIADEAAHATEGS